jgi:UDPglucose--hexose-1-phosphate uridylyltransferase
MRVPRLFHDTLLARPAFVAPDRAGRPGDFDGATPLGGPDRCPFCAGNEPLTPPEVLRSPAAEPGLPGGGPWRARIVPNCFPIVTHAPGMAAATDAARTAHGVHDVVVESPQHVRSILDIDPSAWRDAWELMRRRLELLAGRDDLAWAHVFKNSGLRAGASLEHVHSQLVGLDFVPPVVRAELAAAAAHPFAMLLDRAAAEGRIVAESAGLVALVPPAPRQPYETWILPATAAPHFHAAPPEHVTALAALTQSLVARLGRLAPAADYNWWLHQAPFVRAAGGSAAGWHWHLEILPRIHEFAGFELGTGCHITTLPAAESARQLRGA